MSVLPKAIALRISPQHGCWDPRDLSDILTDLRDLALTLSDNVDCDTDANGHTVCSRESGYLTALQPVIARLERTIREG